MPDIAVWRWPIPSENASKKSWEVRMKGGGTRNTFQRIFRRLISFDKGKQYQFHERLSLIKGLNEDEFQAIIERTSVSACSKLSILLAEEIISRKKLNMQSEKVKQDIYRNSIIDLTHPLAFGYENNTLPLYKNNSIWLKPSKNSYSSVVRYTDDSLIDGFLSENNKSKIKESVSLVVSKVGKGIAVMFADNPNFRGAWYGTNRLFLNAILLGDKIDIP